MFSDDLLLPQAISQAISPPGLGNLNADIFSPLNFR